MAKSRNFTDEHKAKVALEALRGDKTAHEFPAKHKLHPNQFSTRKRQAVDGMADLLSGESRRTPRKLRSRICMPRSGGWPQKNAELPHFALNLRKPVDAYWPGLEEQKQHET